MHLIRLLLSGIAILKDGFVLVRVDEHRKQLLRYGVAKSPARGGGVALRLHRELDQILENAPLPEHPHYGRANAFLLRARRYAASRENGK